LRVASSAIRAPAVAATGNGRLVPELAAGIAGVKSAKSIGVRSGTWPTLRQTQTLLNAPDITTARGYVTAPSTPCRSAVRYADPCGGAHRWALFGRIHAGGDRGVASRRVEASCEAADAAGAALAPLGDCCFSHAKSLGGSKKCAGA